ncbi:MAG: hypothetical protein ABJB85_07470 [Nitrososphaerota archaeon]
MSYYHDLCFVSGCKSHSTVRLKISLKDKAGKFRTFCEVKYLCSLHYKNIGRMKMKGGLPAILENWN